MIASAVYLLIMREVVSIYSGVCTALMIASAVGLPIVRKVESILVGFCAALMIITAVDMPIVEKFMGYASKMAAPAPEAAAGAGPPGAGGVPTHAYAAPKVVPQAAV